MKIIDIKCPHCGGGLHINSERKECFCEYCEAHLFLDDNSRTVRSFNQRKSNLRFSSICSLVAFLITFGIRWQKQHWRPEYTI